MPSTRRVKYTPKPKNVKVKTKKVKKKVTKT